MRDRERDRQTERQTERAYKGKLSKIKEIRSLGYRERVNYIHTK